MNYYLGSEGGLGQREAGRGRAKRRREKVCNNEPKRGRTEEEERKKSGMWGSEGEDGRKDQCRISEGPIAVGEKGARGLRRKEERKCVCVRERDRGGEIEGRNKEVEAEVEVEERERVG